VDLADRPGCKRLGLDRGEDVLPGDAELLLHHDHDVVLVERRHLILQRRQLGDRLRRDQVRPRREDLPELGEGGAELLERQAQPPRTCLGWVGVVTGLVEAVLAEDGRDPRRPAEEPLVGGGAHGPTSGP
jgi:hypothetical protein